MPGRGEDWEHLFTVKFWGNLYEDGNGEHYSEVLESRCY
jgi:hypothetical protein